MEQVDRMLLNHIFSTIKTCSKYFSIGSLAEIKLERVNRLCGMIMHPRVRKIVASRLMNERVEEFKINSIAIARKWQNSKMESISQILDFLRRLTV